MLRLLFKARVILPIIFVIIGILGIAAARVMEAPNNLSTPLTIELKRGSTVRTLARQLQQNDLLSYPELLIIWARINGQATRLHAGEFEIQPGDTFLTY